MIVIDEPVGWDWNELADRIDAGRQVVGGVIVHRLVKIGRNTLSIAACFGAHCLPQAPSIAHYLARPLRDYTHVELGLINAGSIDPTALADVVEFDEDLLAHYVEVAKLPLLINKLLSLSVIHVPAEDVPGIIAHAKAVFADALEDGQYGRGGPGTHNYFSFSD